jgi:transcriptional regulator EpsA
MNGPEFVSLSPRDMDALFYAIEGSLKVRRRFQFFLWSQGGLQSLVPHETLICAWGRIDGNRFKYEVFTRAILDDARVGDLADPLDGLLPRLIAEWQRGGRQPCVYAANDDDTCPPDLRADLQRRGFDQVVAHGPREMKGDTASFFVFLNGAHVPGPRDAYFMELMMPHLHMTLHRMAEGEGGDGGIAPEMAVDGVLSGREVQVLEWVRDGKTNQEIAQILDISPLTVKNHVQKILRKLGAANRAQAVAKAMTLNLLDRGMTGGAGNSANV